MSETWGDKLPKGNRYGNQPAPTPPVDDCSIVQQHNQAFQKQPPAETLDDWEPMSEDMLMNLLPTNIARASTAQPSLIQDIITGLSGPSDEELIKEGEWQDKEKESLRSQITRVTGFDPVASGLALSEEAIVRHEAEALGDEATEALCEMCDALLVVNSKKAVTCGGCGGAFCRGVCWTSHNCGTLCDSNGTVVKIGDKLKHLDGNKKIWEVVAMPATYYRFNMVQATCKNERVHIRPRLMFIL